MTLRNLFRGATAAFAGVAALAAASGLSSGAAKADAVSDFYAGKNVSIYIGLAAGGLYSTFGQILANHLGNHIPGKPTVVIQHMPGAGGLKAMNYVYNVAPKDGTALTTPLTAIVKSARLGQGNVRFDPLKYHWLGGWGEPVTVVSLLKELTPVRTIEDAKKTEVILGAFSKSSNTFLIPNIINELVGTKFKIILGYTGGAKVRLAIEKGEVMGWSGQWEGWTSRKPEWIRDNKLVHLVQLASKRAGPLPDVPLLSEFAKNDDDRRVFEFLQSEKAGRAIAAPPGVPADRLAALEKAYWDTLHDPAFIADAGKRKFEIDPISAAEVTKAVEETMALPDKEVARINELMGFDKKS